MYIKFKEDYIRDLELSDIPELLDNLSPDDETDLLDWTGKELYEAFFELYAKSDEVMSIFSYHHGLVGVIGLTQAPGSKGCEMWLATTTNINKVGTRFLMLTSSFFKALLKKYKYVLGYVESSNEKRIKFIKFCKGKFIGDNLTLRNGNKYLGFIIN